MTVGKLHAPLVPVVVKFPVVNYFDVHYFVKEDGSVWWIGKNVCDVLGYKNSRKALADHVDDEDKGVTICDTLGGKQKTVIINESGLYSLIFNSKLPQAKNFKRWVTNEVLPAIRKNGYYAVPEVEPVEVTTVENTVTNRDGIPGIPEIADDLEIEVKREKFVVKAWNWLENTIDTENLSLTEQSILFQWINFLYKNFLNPVEISTYKLAKNIRCDPRTLKTAVIKLTQKKLLPPPFNMGDLMRLTD